MFKLYGFNQFSVPILLFAPSFSLIDRKKEIASEILRGKIYPGNLTTLIFIYVIINRITFFNK